MRFSRASRLISKHEFKFVFDQPRKISRKYLQVLYRNNAQSQPRLGIIVAKRIMRSAVARNRVRRVIRESFRAHQASLSGLDIVILLKFAVTKADMSRLREEIDGVWHQTPGYES